MGLEENKCSPATHFFCVCFLNKFQLGGSHMFQKTQSLLSLTLLVETFVVYVVFLVMSFFQKDPHLTELFSKSKSLGLQTSIMTDAPVLLGFWVFGFSKVF